MKPTADEQENICKSIPFQKWWFTGFWIFLGILAVLGNGWFLWIFWIFWGFAVVATGTDIFLYDEGIELRMWWLKAFVEWDNVQNASCERWVTRIHVKDVTPPNPIMKTFVNTVLGIGISGGRKNYYFMVDVLAHRLGERFVRRVKKKY